MSKPPFCRLVTLFVFVPLFVLMVVGSIIVYDQGERYYRELNQIRLDPFQIDQYPPEENTPENGQTPEKRVVFFGDSRALFWPAPRLIGYEFINRGIYGQTSVQVSNRFDHHVRPLKPQIVVVQVGINDLKTIGLFPEKRQQIVANCKENIAEIANKAKHRGSAIILTTIFPFGDIPLVRKPFWSDAILPALYEVNAFITELANDHVIVFDAFSILADNRGMMPPKYSIDVLHYNQRGYEKLNQAFSEVLSQLERRFAGKNLKPNPE